MSLHLAESLCSLVRSKYASAQAAESLTFAASELAIVRVCGFPYQLRYCPSLAKKPQPKRDTPPPSGPPKAKPDPFDNPSTQLHVADIPGGSASHLLVLNKFPIIPNHLILATKAHKPQTHFLEQDDLWLTYSALKEWQAKTDAHDGRLFAFFNSGDHSGASQPHRHVQLLPVQDMRHGDTGNRWDLLTDLLVSSDSSSGVEKRGPTQSQVFPISATQLPFRAFGAPLGREVTAHELQELYQLLYKACSATVDRFIAEHPGELKLHSTASGDLPFSYNLAMTTESILMAPRRSDGKAVTRSDGTEVDYVALNGTVLGGTLMVKNEEAFRLLQSDPRKLADVMGAIGIPNAASEHTKAQQSLK